MSQQVLKPLGWPQAGLLRMGANLLSPGGARASLLVLIFHRVLPAPDDLLVDEPDAAAFAAQMDLIRELFNVLVFSEAVERLASGSLPPRAVAITFDDGYSNNLEVAAPILAARGMRATFFITTGFITGGRMWNDTVIEAVRAARESLDASELGLGVLQLPDMQARRRAVDAILSQLKYREPAERIRIGEVLAERAGLTSESRLMMDESQLRRLHSMGMEIGAHCVTHPILSRIPPERAREEIVESKHRLQDVIGSPVKVFAYPNGRPGQDYTREHVAMVREAGFTAAASTAWGASARGSDTLQIPRIAPWDQSSLRYALRMLRGFTEKRFKTV
ncbi:MAG TPA: polysaccharide deacetylase family protein [Steroidobacteraceae bacterium]